MKTQRRKDFHFPSCYIGYLLGMLTLMAITAIEQHVKSPKPDDTEEIYQLQTAQTQGSAVFLPDMPKEPEPQERRSIRIARMDGQVLLTVLKARNKSGGWDTSAYLNSTHAEGEYSISLCSGPAENLWNIATMLEMSTTPTTNAQPATSPIHHP